MVLLKLQIVGSGKRMCMKAFILTILLNQIWPMMSYKELSRMACPAAAGDLRDLIGFV